MLNDAVDYIWQEWCESKREEEMRAGEEREREGRGEERSRGGQRKGRGEREEEQKGWEGKRNGGVGREKVTWFQWGHKIPVPTFSCALL